MQRLERMIIELAATCKNQDEFFTVTKDSISEAEVDIQGDIYDIIGNILQNNSFFDLAIASWKRALVRFRESEDRKNEAGCLLNIGYTYAKLGNHKIAIDKYLMALDIAKDFECFEIEFKSYLDIGNAYSELNEIEKGIKYHEEATKIINKIKNKTHEIALYYNLGTDYYRLGNLKKSIEYNEKALKIANEVGDKEGESTLYARISNILNELGEYNKAEEYKNKSLNIKQNYFSEINDLNNKQKTSNIEQHFIERGSKVVSFISFFLGFGFIYYLFKLNIIFAILCLAGSLIAGYIWYLLYRR